MLLLNILRPCGLRYFESLEIAHNIRELRLLAYICRGLSEGVFSAIRAALVHGYSAPNPKVVWKN